MYSIRPFNYSQVNIQEDVNGYSISIAFDDSCKNSGNLFRSDICVFQGNSDITEIVSNDIFGDNRIIVGTMENLIKVYNWAKSN